MSLEHKKKIIGATLNPNPIRKSNVRAHAMPRLEVEKRVVATLSAGLSCSTMLDTFQKRSANKSGTPYPLENPLEISSSNGDDGVSKRSSKFIADKKMSAETIIDECSSSREELQHNASGKETYQSEESSMVPAKEDDMDEFTTIEVRWFRSTPEPERSYVEKYASGEQYHSSYEESYSLNKSEKPSCVSNIKSMESNSTNVKLSKPEDTRPLISEVSIVDVTIAELERNASGEGTYQSNRSSMIPAKEDDMDEFTTIEVQQFDSTSEPEESSIKNKSTNVEQYHSSYEEMYIFADSEKPSSVSNVKDKEVTIVESNSMNVKTSKPKDNSPSILDSCLLMPEEEYIRGFTAMEIKRLVSAYKRFSTPMYRLEAVAKVAGLEKKPLAELKKLAVMLHERACRCLSENGEKRISCKGIHNMCHGPYFKLGGASIYARTLVACEQQLSLLDEVIPKDADAQKNWMIFWPIRPAHFDVNWNMYDDSRLLIGVLNHGLGSWQAIKDDDSLNIGHKILLTEDKEPQGRHLEKRVNYLLHGLDKYKDIMK